MALGPGLLKWAQRQESQKAQIAIMRKRVHAIANSDDPDKATLASAFLHLADCINQNTEAITAIQKMLTQGR
jgi:hypothetical protein